VVDVEMKWEAVPVYGTNLVLMIAVPETASENDTPERDKIILMQHAQIQTLVEVIDLLLDTLPDTCQFSDDPSWGWAWNELSGQAQDRVKFARDGANVALAPFKDLDKTEGSTL
jgi:hypothetical protein